jgi:pyrroloquinoline-quinone synthase
MTDTEETMDSNAFLEALDALVAEKHLLKHEFYRLWTDGKLTRENIRDYAVAYYPHVAAFPRYVSAVHSGTADAGLRQELLENLIEEERGESNHPALWRRFASALGADESELSTAGAAARIPDIARLVETFLDATRNGSTAEGLAALYAYESQIPEIAKTKREGLAAFYGIEDPESVRFFSVHEQADVWHRRVEREAIGRLAATATEEERRAALATAWRCLDALNRALDAILRETRAAA